MSGVHHVDDFRSEILPDAIEALAWLPEIPSHALHIAHRKGAAGSETLVAAGQCADALAHADRLEADALDQIFHLPNTHASDQPARYHREFIVDRVADKVGRVEAQEGQRLG